MTLLTTAFIVAFIATLGIVRFSHTHAHLTNDHDLSGVQKFHSTPVPRIGGLGIVLGVVAGVLLVMWREIPLGTMPWLLLACGVPTFAAGIIEDVTKTVSPRARLAFTALSALLAGWALQAWIQRTDIPGLDWLVGFGVVSALVTVFAVSGVANSVNLIDGFNGLSSMCVMMMLGCLALVGFEVGDRFVMTMALIGLGAVLGFFVFNFPAGLIFLGDGGAYFLGFYLAELAILLLARNPSVSPMFPLMMCIYPIFETVFSMYRRKVVQGKPVGMPDATHLHSLIYRRLVRSPGRRQSPGELTRRNSMTSPYLWLLCMLSLLPAMMWWDSTPVLTGFLLLFVLSYTGVYRSIVHFKTPTWLVMRR